MLDDGRPVTQFRPAITASPALLECEVLRVLRGRDEAGLHSGGVRRIMVTDTGSVHYVSLTTATQHAQVVARSRRVSILSSPSSSRLAAGRAPRASVRSCQAHNVTDNSMATGQHSSPLPASPTRVAVADPARWNLWRVNLCAASAETATPIDPVTFLPTQVERSARRTPPCPPAANRLVCSATPNVEVERIRWFGPGQNGRISDG
jgi:hypothetical protein